MTVELKSTRRVCVIGWDTEVVKGSHASIQIQGEEKRNVDNDGDTNIFFPLKFSGDVEITVVGSKEGKDSGTIHIA